MYNINVFQIFAWHDSFLRAIFKRQAKHIVDIRQGTRLQWHDSRVCMSWILFARHSMTCVGITGLFCKRALQKRRYSAKETYNLIDPTQVVECRANVRGLSSKDQLNTLYIFVKAPAGWYDSRVCVWHEWYLHDMTRVCGLSSKDKLDPLEIFVETRRTTTLRPSTMI